MKQRSPSVVLLATGCAAWLSLSVAGCDLADVPDDALRTEADGVDADVEAPDEDVWAHERLMRSVDGGPLESLGGSCSLLTDDAEAGGGGGGGPDFAEVMAFANGEASYRYFVAAEGTSPEVVTPETGTLAGEIVVDRDTLLDGEVQHLVFEAGEGATYEAFVWGESDCDDPLGDPPAP